MIEDWAICYRNDKYKVLRQDRSNNLFFTTSKNSIKIVKDLTFSSLDSQIKFEIDGIRGDQIQDFRPFNYYTYLIFASRNGILSVLNWKNELICTHSLPLRSKERVTCLSVGRNNNYIIVATCNEEGHSPRLYLFEYHNLERFRFLDVYDFDEMKDKLSKKNSSYIYDISMDYYLYGRPVIVAVQCHYERRLIVFTVMDDRLLNFFQKDCKYSNCRVVRANDDESVAVVGSNQCITIMSFLALKA